MQDSLVFEENKLPIVKEEILFKSNFDNNKIGSHIAEMQWKLIEFLKSDNPNFNENKFIKAMNINLPKLKKELDN